MMTSFFKNWKLALVNNINDISFKIMFLNNLDHVKDELINSSKEEATDIISLLTLLDLDNLIDTVFQLELNVLASSDVYQFSKFEDGTKKIVEMLVCKNKGLTFDEIGYEFLGKRNDGALKKYGENHSKLSSSLFLSYINREKNNSSYVYVSELGKQFAALDSAMQDKILKILFLKNPLIKNLLIKSKNDSINFKDEVSFLSDKTILRRTSNCKFVFEFVLNNTKYEKLKNRVIW